MFDIGFLELAVILVLGLLVLGPERLPLVAKKIGYWLGKGRRYMDTVKSQVESEFDTADVKRLLKDQEDSIRKLQAKITDSGKELNAQSNSKLQNDDLASLADSVNDVEDVVPYIVPYKETLNK